MEISEMTIDPNANLQIRPTDNSLKEEDLEGVSQDPTPIKVGDDGLPIGWNPPEDGE